MLIYVCDPSVCEAEAEASQIWYSKILFQKLSKQLPILIKPK